MKKYQIITLIILIIIIIAILINLIPKTQSQQTIIIKGYPFNLEIADTPSEHSKGLMFRESLQDDQGMLFVFNNEKPRSFWMKNTLIPLDLIFINSDYKITDIKSNFKPCKIQNCPTYTSKPAKYVIEINGGLADELGLNIGDFIELKQK